jgi:hypothetical protein
VQVQSIAPALPQTSAAGEAQSDAAVAVTPKAEEERPTNEAKAAEDKEPVKKVEIVPEAKVTVPQKPATPSVQPVKPTPIAQDACAGVRVTGPSGMPVRGARIVITEISSSSGERVYSGHAGPNGNMFHCGLKAGNRVRIAVFARKDGVKGALRANREAVLTPGRNYIEVQLSDEPDVRGPGPRRPRRQRH